jgi:chemotaxis protein methyltransferase CheR
VNDTDWTEAGYENVLRLFGARTGLAFRSDQHQTTRQAIRSAMDASGVSDPHDFARRLEHDPRALDELIIKLTVPETYFFREPAQFDYLRREILPEFRQRRRFERLVRIWSAGCSSGEEAYSLAILCTQEGLARQTHILATDISPVALGKAREGLYGNWSLRGASAVAARAYLVADGDRYHVDPQLRRLVQFEFLNLALDVYPSFVTGTVGLDLILCRNVLIYFNRETIREVAQRLHDSLAPGGWLITGAGDPSLEQHADYESVVTAAGVFYRRPLKRTTADAGKTPPSNAAEDTVGEAECETRDEWFRPVETVAIRAPAVTNPPPSVFGTVADSLREARAALVRGDYSGAVRWTEDFRHDPGACVLHLKALANIDTLNAVQASVEAVQRHALSPELHYLHAVLLMEVNRDAEAVQAARRAVFLDRSLAIAHFTLGSILQRRGALRDAQRYFRNARDLCAARPPDEIVPLTEGEAAGRLAEAAGVQLDALHAAVGRRS